MIFPKKHIKPILQGKTTLLVHPHRPTDDQILDDGSIVPYCPLQIGRSYSVKTSGTGKEISRFRPTGFWEARLHELTDAQARDAGFISWEDLRLWWFERYNEGPGAKAEPLFPVMVIPVWMVRFELFLEQPTRYLRPGPRGGYTTNPSEALRDGAEAEWCPPGTWTSEPNRTHAKERAGDALDELNRHLDEIRRWGAVQGVDMRPVVRAAEQRAAKLRKKAA